MESEYRFQYADDTSHWEEWQRGYLYGAFYIFPPAGVIEAIDEMRSIYDPASHRICQAHISLSEPLRGPLSDDQIEELRSALSAIASLQIEYGPLRSFPPHPGVCFAIRPEDKFQQLRTAVQATSLFKHVPLKHTHIDAHITVAEFITIERTAELMRQLMDNAPQGKFECKAIEYAVPNKDFYFERVLTIELAQ